MPARAIGRVTYAANPTTLDTTYRFVGGNSTEPLQFDAGRGGSFLGSPKIESSAMVATTTTGSKIMVGGDLKAFVIADRIGLSVSVIPHLFGGSQRPTGQGGLYAFWRTGSVVAAPNLLRYLEVK
jgi:HK97 family phage major capsid protein